MILATGSTTLMTPSDELSPLRRSVPVLCLILFCVILFIPGLSERELTSSHEARAAQNAQSMLANDNWLLPSLLDRRVELQKPPLYYWLVAIIGWLQGGNVDEWSVRLPSALSALGCVLWLYVLGVRCGRARAGLLAAFVLASCVHFTWLARVGRIDMPLTFAITAALGCFHLGQVEARRRWHFLGYTALALGILLKGPIAVVLPSVVCAAAWLERDRLDWRRHWHHLRTTSLWWGVPWMLLVAAPWFVWANHRTQNQLFEVFFWYHNVERGMGGSETLAAHPWWFYGPRAVVDLLPWSLVAPFAFYWFVRNEETRRDASARAGLFWFIGVTLFLSCMRFKRADYLLPAYPGMAIFLGICAERALTQLNTAAVQCLSRAFVMLMVVYASGWTIYTGWFAADPDKPYQAMAAEIRRQTDRPVIFFRAESHVLHFHVGHPLDTILEWENLAIWAKEPFPVYFVMPEDCARDWPKYLPSNTLEVVLRTSDYPSLGRDRPLVVLRSNPIE